MGKIGINQSVFIPISHSSSRCFSKSVKRPDAEYCRILTSYITASFVHAGAAPGISSDAFFSDEPQAVMVARTVTTARHMQIIFLIIVIAFPAKYQQGGCFAPPFLPVYLSD